MNGRTLLIVGLIVGLCALLLVGLESETACATDIIVDGGGDGDYLTIQEGIDNSSATDTVYIWDGTYNENVVVNKSVSLVGNGSASTIIDGGGGSIGLSISSSWVNVSGVNVTNSSAYGIYVLAVDNVVVEDCVVNQLSKGVYLSNSTDSIIHNNIFFYCVQGVYSSGGSNNNTISSNNIIHGGVSTTYGMILPSSDDFHIFSNVMYNVRQGITLYSSTHGMNIYNNNISGSTIAILNIGDNSTIFDNYISNGVNGIYVSGVDNLMYSNILSNLTYHGNDTNGNNDWNISSGGNFWDNWTSPDTNNDGIVDSPRAIGGGLSFDYLPLTILANISSPANNSHGYDLTLFMWSNGTLYGEFWNWSWGDGGYTNTTSPTGSHTYSTGGNYTITLLVWNSTLGCSDSVFINISVISSSVIVDGGGNGDYLTIQEGIDNSSSGDTVYIWNGTYVENIIVDQQISIVGNGTNCIIDGSGASVVTLSANYVNVSGLNIYNASGGNRGVSYTGIGRNFCSIFDNNIYNCSNGIIVDGNNNYIYDNTFFNNTYGVAYVGVYSYIFNNTFFNNTEACHIYDRNFVFNNTMYDNSGNDLFIIYDNNEIYNNSLSKRILLSGSYNKIHNSTLFGLGSGATTSNYNEFYDNIIVNASYFDLDGVGNILYDNSFVNISYIQLIGDENIFYENYVNDSIGFGLSIIGDSTQVFDSYFYNNSYGIRASSDGNHSFHDNLFNVNTYGLYGSLSFNDSIIYNNTFFNNTNGIYLDATNITVYNNIFINNTLHAYELSVVDNNIWNTTIGNFWDNWTSPDSDLDGVVDNPFPLHGGGFDYLPLTIFANISTPDGDIAFSSSPQTVFFWANESRFAEYYNWTWGDGSYTNTTSISSSHTFLSSGSFDVVLTVYNSSWGLVGIDTMNVAVGVIANISSPVDSSEYCIVPYNVFVWSNGTLYGEYWNWTWGDGGYTNTTSPTGSHTYLTGGSYTVTLTVWNSTLVESDSVSINITFKYVITNVYDLQNMSLVLDGDFVLGNDIDASVTSTWNSGKGFLPVGNRSSPFEGNLEGQGYNISGLYINGSWCSWGGSGGLIDEAVGLFGTTDGDVLISNVTLVDVTVISDDAYPVGTLVGDFYGSMYNCYAYGGIYDYGDGWASWGYGGLVGSIEDVGSTSVFRNNHAFVDIIATNCWGVGGLVGECYEVVIDNCSSSGNVTGYVWVGGLVAYVSSSAVVENCTVYGNTNGSMMVGGLAGDSDGVVKYCTVYGDVLGISLLGEIVGVDGGSSFNNVFYGTLSTRPIYTVLELQSMRYNLSGDYRLGCDIDASVTSTWSSGTGFRPIGHSTSDDFVGSFDGRGYNITNLYINRPTTDYVGLFGITDSGCSISNVSIVNADVTGDDGVGGLVGYNYYGSISMCSSSGDVSGTDYVGGLCGWNFYGDIHYSDSSMGVSGSSYIGGLVGFIQGSGSFGLVEYSFATGGVSGSHSNVGGLVGVNSWGTVRDSFATGGVLSSGYNVGGLVGKNYNGEVRDCYSIGGVSGSFNVGGLIGYISGSVYTSYYDYQTSGRSDNDGRGVPKSTAEMKTESTFVGWNFVSTWSIIENVTYPLHYGSLPVSSISSPIDGSHNYDVPSTVFVWSNGTAFGETYRWDWGDSSFTNSTSPVGSHTYTSTGEYIIILSVWNSSLGYTDTDAITITVGHPMAVISSPANNSHNYGVLNLAHVFVWTNGTQYGEYYNWSWGDGTYANSTSSNNAKTYSSAGSYTITLTVWNSILGFSDTTQITITVGHPIAIISSPTSGFHGLNLPYPLMFWANGTTNAETYEWEWGDDYSDNSSNPFHFHTFSSIGIYYVNLTVWNSTLGFSNTTSITLSFGSPTAVISSPVNNTNFESIPSVIHMDSVGSLFAEYYNWSWGDGTYTNSTSSTNSHAYISEGRYLVNLTVSNSSLGWASDTYSITITLGARVLNVDTGFWYFTIQEGVDNSSDGHTVEVSGGVFIEQVTVDKEIMLVGDGAIINGSGGVCFSVVDDSVSISDFTITNGSVGVSVGLSTNVIISHNLIENNSVGVSVGLSTNIHIYNNTFSINGVGVSMLGTAQSNMVYYNRFENNTDQAEDDGTDNVWDDGVSEGNFWSDYEGEDRDRDGIGDSELPHHGDRYPLTDTRPSPADQLYYDSQKIMYLVIVFLAISTVVGVLFASSKSSNNFFRRRRV